MAFVEKDHSRPRFAGEVEILLGFFDDDPIARAPLGVGLALVIGSLAYAASAVSALLAQRETPKEIARIRQIAENSMGDVDGRPSPGAARV